MAKEYRLIAKGKCIGFIKSSLHFAQVLEYAIKVCEADTIELI